MGLGFFIRYYFWPPYSLLLSLLSKHTCTDGEYATCYEIKLHALLMGTIDR